MIYSFCSALLIRNHFHGFSDAIELRYWMCVSQVQGKATRLAKGRKVHAQKSRKIGALAAVAGMMSP
jgi:hypothetical protein